MPFLSDIHIEAAGETPEQKIDSLVKQLNNWGRVISAEAASLRSESSIQMHPQWTNSWTTNSTYTDITGSLGEINFDDWLQHYWYFEMIAKTDGGTGYYRLFNITDNEAVPGSEISTTSTTPVRLRSDPITKYLGTKDFKIQHRIEGGNGSQFVNSMMSRIIFKVGNIG